MCSGKNGAGSPQGYNTGVVPPQGGMQQFANIQNQFQKSPWDVTRTAPPGTGGFKPAPGMPGGSAGYVPTSAAQNYGAGSGMDQGGTGYPPMPANGYPGGEAAWRASQDIIRSGNEAPPGFMYQPSIQGGYGTGGLQPAMGRPTNEGGDPGLGAGYVRPEMGLLGGGPVGGPTRTGGMTPMQTGSMGTINNPNMTPELQAQLDKARSMFPAEAAGHPIQGGPNMGPDHTGWGGGQKMAQFGPARDGGLARMAGAAAYQQSLTPEMLQQQINNGQRAPTSYTQMQGMLNAMDPAARADYIAKYKARTGQDPTAAPIQGTPGNPFGN